MVRSPGGCEFCFLAEATFSPFKKREMVGQDERVGRSPHHSPSVNFLTEIFALNEGDVCPDCRVCSLQCSCGFGCWVQSQAAEEPRVCVQASVCPSLPVAVAVVGCMFLFKLEKGLYQA